MFSKKEFQKISNYRVSNSNFKQNDDLYEKAKLIVLASKTGSRKKNIESMLNQGSMIYELCEKENVINFFEIGTGRGTTSYIVSLLKNINKIVTLDILSFDKKRDTYVNFEKANISNKDIYDTIPFKEKTKITFLNKTSLTLPLEEYKEKFDIVFIDGNHKVYDFIKKDFEVAEALLQNSNGKILMDDYGPDWAATHFVDELMNTRNDLTFELIQTMNKERYGHVLISYK